MFNFIFHRWTGNASKKISIEVVQAFAERYVKNNVKRFESDE